MRKTKRTKTKKVDDLSLKEVCRVWGSAEAEVIKSFLKSNGITCLLRGNVVQSVHPFSVDGLGEIRILVPAKDHSSAKELLKSHSKE